MAGKIGSSANESKGHNRKHDFLFQLKGELIFFGYFSCLK